MYDQVISVLRERPEKVSVMDLALWSGRGRKPGSRTDDRRGFAVAGWWSAARHRFGYQARGRTTGR
jgi:hypothetical protein